MGGLVPEVGVTAVVGGVLVDGAGAIEVEETLVNDVGVTTLVVGSDDVFGAWYCE